MKHLVLALGLLAASNVSAQFTPDFEFYLYITDYFGNRDSVLIGYSNQDTMTRGVWGPNLGAALFNDTLEARIVEWDPPISGTNFDSWEKVYVPWNCDPHPQMSGSIPIAFTAKYPPITFSWNRNDFQADCRDNSTITTSEMYLQHPDAIDEALHITMSGADSMYLRLDTAVWESFYYPWLVLENQPMQSGDSSNLYFVYMTFANDSLYYTSIEENQAASISVYPTATSSQININSEIEPVEKVLLYNLQGQVLQQWQGYTNQVDISRAAAGMYILEVQTKKHRRREKIIKY